MKIKPDGTYTVEITGLDSSLSLSGKDPKKEIFYRDPKTFEPISREDRLKVNEMSNIKNTKELTGSPEGRLFAKKQGMASTLDKYLNSKGVRICE